MKNACLLLISIVLLAAMGCNDPYKLTVPANLDHADGKFTDGIKKLPEKDKVELAAYLMRQGIGQAMGNAPTLGVTVREAIDDQRQFEAAQAKKEAEAKALAEKVRAKQAAAQKAMDDVLLVAVTDKRFSPSNFRANKISDTIEMSIAFENKSSRDLKGVKGTVVFADLFGDVIRRINLSVDDPVAAGKTMVWRGSVHYNQFENEDHKLAQTSLDKMKISWEPAVYIFSDGSTMTMPQ